MANNAKVADGKHLGTALCYVVFLAIAALVFHMIADGEFSSILTISAIFQCLAVSLLGWQVFSHGSATGISAKCLQLDALALVCRLSATTHLNGYIPSDYTGDWLYQSFDFLCLVGALWLLREILVVQADSYEAEADEMNVGPFAAGAFILAACFHADLNDRPIFDALWLASLNLGVVSVIPQLWMMTRRQKSLPALTSHFIAIMGLSRVLNGVYMWHAYEEITCEPWIGNFNHAIPAILGAHLIHVMILGDFTYLYAKNVLNSGLEAPLELPGAWIV